MDITVKIIDMNGEFIPRMNNYALVKKLIDDGQAMITCAMPFTIQLLESSSSLIAYPFDIELMNESQKAMIKEAAIALLKELE